MTKQEKIKKLSDQVLEFKKAYYNDEPIISDDEYDLIEDSLRILDPNNRVLKLTGIDIKERNNWPTQNLFVRMGSLNKVKSIAEFSKWFSEQNNSNYLFNPKGDGISIQLKYENGNLISATTRGNGFQGEDILENVLKMKNVNDKINNIAKKDIILKGEIVCCHEDFEKIKSQGYANPRNAASGIAKSNDGFNCEHLTILYYGVHINNMEVKPSEVENFLNKMEVKSIGFYGFNDLNQLKQTYDEITNDRNRFGFDIDGLVIKEDNDAIYHNNCPTNQIALKFPAQKGIAQIDSIKFQQGRTNRLTPVATFVNPIYLGGAQISKCSLGSWGLVLEKEIYPGSIVEVIRANDVIPYINHVVDSSQSKPISIYDIRKELNDDTVYLDGENLFIEANKSRETIINEIFHIFNILEIKNISKRSIESMVDFFNIKECYEIFDCNFDELVNLDGWGKSKIKTIKEQLTEKKSSVDLNQMVRMLNIANLGNSRTTEIINSLEVKTLEQFLNLTVWDLLKVPTIQDRLSETIWEGLNNRKEIGLELNKRLTIENKSKVVGDSLKGICFSITGKTSKPRKEMEKFIESLGGKNTSINKATYLITNDSSSNSSKNKNAEKLGVKIISEKEFEEMTGN